MKTKIQIKSVFGKVLFEHESENNTIKQTLIEACKKRANLWEADLWGADLRGADLWGADLRGADLWGADLRGADLWGADLWGADLRGAKLMGSKLMGSKLMGADLEGAKLDGADLEEAKLEGANYGNITIDKIAVFTGLYRYGVYAIIDKEGKAWIRMGCHFRSLEEWEADFWNNTSEFPNDGSEKSRLREFAFQTAKNWINLTKQSK